MQQVAGGGDSPTHRVSHTQMLCLGQDIRGHNSAGQHTAWAGAAMGPPQRQRMDTHLAACCAEVVTVLQSTFRGGGHSTAQVLLPLPPPPSSPGTLSNMAMTLTRQTHQAYS